MKTKPIWQPNTKTKKNRGEGVFKFISKTYKKAIAKKNEKQQKLSQKILLRVLSKLKGNKSIPSNKNMFKIIIQCIEDNLLFDLKNDTPTTLENAINNAKLLKPYISKNMIKIQNILTQKNTTEFGNIHTNTDSLENKSQEQINDIYIQLQNKENLDIQYFLLWLVNFLKVIDHYFQDEFTKTTPLSHDIQDLALTLASHGPSITQITQEEEEEEEEEEQQPHTPTSQDKDNEKEVNKLLKLLEEESDEKETPSLKEDIVSVANQLNEQHTSNEETRSREQMIHFLEKLNKNNIITDLFPTISFTESLKIMTRLLKKTKNRKGGGVLLKDTGSFFDSIYMSNNNTCNQQLLPIWWELHYMHLIILHMIMVIGGSVGFIIFVILDILALLRCIECRRRKEFEYEPLNSLLRSFYDDDFYS
jgi:hypothetical protein